VARLAARNLRVLLDFHQDVWNEAFAGEGAPDWAVCTDGVPPSNTGTWNANYAEPAVGIAFRHFWLNDVRGNLQGEYDRVWRAVAAHYRGNHSILGYDLFNEPFSTEVYSVGGAAAFAEQLECAYTGRRHPGTLNYTGAPAVCAPTIPAEGMIPSILAADPGHLIFYEPDISSDFGNLSYIGSMPFPNLVLNFHDYCFVGGLMGSFQSNTPDCPPLEQQVFERKQTERAFAVSRHQPQGPGWFLSEFGAEDAAADLERMTRYADDYLVGWTYWQWRQYQDPTGSPTEGMFNADGSLKPKAALLSRTYARATAGTPTAMSFDPASGRFRLAYLADPKVHGPTEVFVPLALHYPGGYCARASGATLTSAPNAQLLTLVNRGRGSVTLELTPGPC
jgi:endoglycosylceramidase